MVRTERLRSPWREIRGFSQEELQESYDDFCRGLGFSPKHLKRISHPGWAREKIFDQRLWRIHLEREDGNRWVIFTEILNGNGARREIDFAFLVDSSFSKVWGVAIQEGTRKILINFGPPETS